MNISIYAPWAKADEATYLKTIWLFRSKKKFGGPRDEVIHGNETILKVINRPQIQRIYYKRPQRPERLQLQRQYTKERE